MSQWRHVLLFHLIVFPERAPGVLYYMVFNLGPIQNRTHLHFNFGQSAPVSPRKDEAHTLDRYFLSRGLSRSRHWAVTTTWARLREQSLVLRYSQWGVVHRPKEW